MSYISLAQINDLEEKAQNGNLDARLSMASLYMCGESVPLDYRKAVDFLDRASVQAKDDEERKGVFEAASNVSDRLYNDMKSEGLLLNFKQKAEGKDTSSFEDKLNLQARVMTTISNLMARQTSPIQEVSVG